MSVKPEFDDISSRLHKKGQLDLNEHNTSR